MYLEINLPIEYNLLENDRKMTFFQRKLNFIDLGRARTPAHGYDDAKNQFFDHCRVGFYFESLSLEEN